MAEENQEIDVISNEVEEAAEEEAVATEEPEGQEPEEGSESPVEGDTDESTDEPVGEQEKPAKPVNPAKPRIQQLVHQRNEARAEAEALRRRLAQAEAEAAKLQPPKEDDFDDLEEYEKAVARHENRKDLVEFDKSRTTAAMQEAQNREKDAAFGEFVERSRDYAAMNPEFTQDIASMNQRGVIIPEHVGEAINAADHGPAVLHHLARNPELSHELAAMTPIQAIRKVTLLEAQLSAQPKPKQKRSITNAPPPGASLTPSAPVARSSDERSDAEWIAKRRQELAAKRR